MAGLAALVGGGLAQGLRVPFGSFGTRIGPQILGDLRGLLGGGARFAPPPSGAGQAGRFFEPGTDIVLRRPGALGPVGTPGTQAVAPGASLLDRVRRFLPSRGETAALGLLGGAAVGLSALRGGPEADRELRARRASGFDLGDAGGSSSFDQFQQRDLPIDLINQIIAGQTQQQLAQLAPLERQARAQAAAQARRTRVGTRGERAAARLAEIETRRAGRREAQLARQGAAATAAGLAGAGQQLAAQAGFGGIGQADPGALAAEASLRSAAEGAGAARGADISRRAGEQFFRAAGQIGTARGQDFAAQQAGQLNDALLQLQLARQQAISAGPEQFLGLAQLFQNQEQARIRNLLNLAEAQGGAVGDDFAEAAARGFGGELRNVAGAVQRIAPQSFEEAVLALQAEGIPLAEARRRAFERFGPQTAPGTIGTGITQGIGMFLPQILQQLRARAV